MTSVCVGVCKPALTRTNSRRARMTPKVMYKLMENVEAAQRGPKMAAMAPIDRLTP